MAPPPPPPPGKLGLIEFIAMSRLAFQSISESFNCLVVWEINSQKLFQIKYVKPYRTQRLAFLFDPMIMVWFFSSTGISHRPQPEISETLINRLICLIKRSTVEPLYNEVLGTMKITLLYQVSHYIRVKKQKNIKSWDQQNYLVIRGFC